MARIMIMTHQDTLSGLTGPDSWHPRTLISFCIELSALPHCGDISCGSTCKGSYFRLTKTTFIKSFSDARWFAGRNKRSAFTLKSCRRIPTGQACMACLTDCYISLSIVKNPEVERFDRWREPQCSEGGCNTFGSWKAREVKATYVSKMRLSKDMINSERDSSNTRIGWGFSSLNSPPPPFSTLKRPYTVRCLIPDF